MNLGEGVWVNEHFPIGKIAAVELTAGEAADSLQRYAMRITSAATAHPPGRAVATPIACRRRPGHHACHGRIDTRWHELPPAVQWVCPVCLDRGVVHGWRRGPADLSRPGPPPDDISIRIPSRIYTDLRRAASMPEGLSRILHGAQRSVDCGVLLSGTCQEMESLHHVLLAFRETCQAKRVRSALGRVAVRIEGRLARS
jgi:hypothetical protein